MNWYNFSDEMALGFDDVLLVPQLSKIKSRKDIYLTDPYTRNDALPIMSSPMDTVTGLKMAKELVRHQAIPILHRNMPNSDILEILTEIDHSRFASQRIGFAVGADTSDAQLDFIRLVDMQFPNLIVCLDIAHGHTSIALSWIKTIRDRIDLKNTKLMVGSVCTVEAVEDLSQEGADIIRFGVGNGSICSTRLNTGHGYPQFSGLCEVASFLGGFNTSIELVADGGIRNAGDAAKALAAGADYVMLGSMLAGTDESPGAFIDHGGQQFKSYRGMASQAAQEARLGKAWSIEGVDSLVARKGPVSVLLDEFRANLKSAYSYSGANGLRDFQHRAQFVRVSPSTIHGETGTHIFNIASRSL